MVHLEAGLVAVNRKPIAVLEGVGSPHAHVLIDVGVSPPCADDAASRKLSL